MFARLQITFDFIFYEHKLAAVRNKIEVSSIALYRIYKLFRSIILRIPFDKVRNRISLEQIKRNSRLPVIFSLP